MVKTLLIVVLAAIVLALLLALLFATTRPDSFEVQRSVLVSAPAEKVFPLIADLRAMSTWNPFEKQDEQVQRRYSGPASGPGAALDFEGKKAGAGRIEITEAQPSSRVAMTLHMTAPLEARNNIVFTLAPEGNATRVTWVMNGGVPYLAKVIQLVVSMDRMVGGQFESGLADLKARAEKS